MDWSPDFCLACDRQTDGGLYCGESCRLSEYERANCSSASSPSSSPSSSPTYKPSGAAWATTTPSKNAITRSNFYLPPAYDFSTFRSSSVSASTQFLLKSPVAPTFSSKMPALTPSSSQSSLTSLNSVSSTDSQPSTLSAEARRELRNYASSFDQSRYSRRQSA